MTDASFRRLPRSRESHSKGVAKLTEKMSAKVSTPKKTRSTSYSASMRVSSNITTKMVSTILRGLFGNCFCSIGRRRANSCYKIRIILSNIFRETATKTKKENDEPDLGFGLDTIAYPAAAFTWGVPAVRKSRRRRMEGVHSVVQYVDHAGSWPAAPPLGVLAADPGGRMVCFHGHLYRVRQDLR